MTGSQSTLTRELAQTEGQLRLLLGRKSEIEAALAAASAPAPAPRPGWPIRRLAPDHGVNLH